MGVNKFGIRRLLPEMNHRSHDCSSDSLVNGKKVGQAQGTTTTTTGLLSQQVEEVSSLNSSGIFNEDIDALKLSHKMRLKLCQEDLTRGVGGQYPPDLTGHTGSLNVLLNAGANHELSMSLPNLTAALDTELLNEVNERHVRSSLSNIFDGKQDLCTQKSLSELSKCIKTLSSEDFQAACKGGSDSNCRPQTQDKKGGTTPSSPGVNMEDIKIEMNGGNNRLSAVLENIPLLYIPHTKQLVSVMPQGNSKVSSPSGSKSPPTSPVHLTTNHKLPLAHPEGTPQNANNHHGLDTEELSRNHSENGYMSPSKVETSPLASSCLLPSHQSYSNLDSSLNDSQTNLLNCSEGDVNFALSQDSDASSTCRSEHTVIHQEDFPTSASSQARKDSRTVDFDDEEESLECLSKVSLDQDDSPRSTIERTNTMGSLSRADGSSFSSISSISTATDFSASAASCSDDYLELKNCGDVDESGFMEVNLHSRNTFERSRNSSQDSGIDEKLCLGAKPKRRGLSSFFARSDATLWTDCQPSILKNIFSRKATKEPVEAASGSGGSSSSSSSSSNSSSTGPGWRLFGRIPPKQIPQKDTQDITREYQTKVKVPHPGAPRGKRPDVEAPSTTALILENRPSNLPSKDPEEELRHRIEYEAMIEASKKREQREAKLRKKQQQQQLKQEEALAAALRVWNKDILPNWDNSKNSKKARDLWWHGIPPAVRGKVWQLAIGNELNLTPELYEICLNRAKDRLKLMQDAGDSDSICSQVSEPSSSKEGSVEVIKLDVSRTFPQLCIFQKGGPYYELLQGLLGAYACYRPDVGYVQGMSFIAAVLLLNMEVDDAFICFANLLNRPCQIAFFRLDESLMKSYFLTYEEFFKENLPRLFAVFQKQGLTPDLYIIDWMFTLYAKSLPFDVASRVWDVFCRDGEEFLFRTALGILRMYEDILLSLDFIHLAQFLTKLPENIPSDTLFRSIDSINMAIDKKRFAQVFTQFREPKET